MQHRFVRGESVTVPPTAEGWVPSPVAHHQAQGQSRRPLGCPRPRGAVGAQLLESGARGKRGGAGSDCFRAAPAAPPARRAAGGSCAAQARTRSAGAPRRGRAGVVQRHGPDAGSAGQHGLPSDGGRRGVKKKRKKEGERREEILLASCWGWAADSFIRANFPVRDLCVGICRQVIA